MKPPYGYVHLYSAYEAKSRQEVIEDIKAIFNSAKIKDIYIARGHMRPESKEYYSYRKPWVYDPSGYTVYVLKGVKQ
jgi:hypothetical protein